MDFANFWLPIIGSILLGGIAVGAWYGGSKIVALWIGFAGVVCLLVLAVLQIQKGILESDKLPTLSATERPWVAIQALQIISPVAYDDRDWNGKRWHVVLRYELANTGATPAIGVNFYARLLPFLISTYPPERIKDHIPQGAPEPGTDTAVELKKMCDSAASFSSAVLPTSSGTTLFRDKSSVGTLHVNADPAVFEAAKKSPGYTGNFVLLVCASYRFTFGDRIHQTGEAYAIFKKTGDMKINLDGETIPIENLGFVPQPLSGSFTN